MVRYTITGLFAKDGSNVINSTVDFHRKKDALDCIKNNFATNKFDTIIIRKFED